MTVQATSFPGEETFAVTPDRLFESLTEPEQLALIIPDRVSHSRIDDRTLKCTVRPGFSFIRANMQMMITITQASPEGGIDYAISSQGIGAAMNVDCRLRISHEADGARIAREASISRLSGLISAVSPTLIRGAADKVIRDGWTRLREHVEGSNRA